MNRRLVLIGILLVAGLLLASCASVGGYGYGYYGYPYGRGYFYYDYGRPHGHYHYQNHYR